VLITSLPSAQALQDVARELSGKGRVVIETSTLPIEEKQKARDALAKKGITLPTARSPAPARRRARRIW